jgi:hypothetical protein
MVQCLLLGGLLLGGRMLLHVGQAMFSLLMQTPSLWALQLHCLFQLCQYLLQLYHLLGQLLLDMLCQLQNAGELHVVTGQPDQTILQFKGATP